MLHLEKNLHHLPIIDRGESDVYRYDDTHVLKRYPGFPIETISIYQTITRQVGHIMDGQPLVFTLPQPRISASFICRVVPIESIVTDQSGTPCAISEYVPSPQLLTIIQEGSMYEPNHFTDPLRTIASHDKMIFYRTLEIVNQGLRAAIRNPNVLLAPINMKIIDEMCIITDVASNVRLFHIFRGFIGHYL